MKGLLAEFFNRNDFAEPNDNPETRLIIGWTKLELIEPKWIDSTKKYSKIAIVFRGGLVIAAPILSQGRALTKNPLALTKSA